MIGAEWASIYRRGRAATELRHRRVVRLFYAAGWAAIGLSLLLALVLGGGMPATPVLLAAGGIGVALVAFGRFYAGRVPPGDPVLIRALVRRKRAIRGGVFLGVEVREAAQATAGGQPRPYPRGLGWTTVSVDAALGQLIGAGDEVTLLCTPEGFGVELLPAAALG